MENRRALERAEDSSQVLQITLDKLIQIDSSLRGLIPGFESPSVKHSRKFYQINSTPEVTLEFINDFDGKYVIARSGGNDLGMNDLENNQSQFKRSWMNRRSS